MTSDLYRQIIMEHFRNPQNTQELKDFDQTGEAANASCGDVVWVQLKYAGDRLKNVSIRAQGCAVSIAAASVLSEEIKGKTKNEIKAYTLDNLLALLGIKPGPQRRRCASLGLEAVHNLVTQ